MPEAPLTRRSQAKFVSFCLSTLAILFLTSSLPVCAASVDTLQENASEILLRPEIKAGPKFTLEASVNAALKNYPTVVETESKAKATSAEVTLVKTTYLPRIDIFLQELRGSVNNTIGVLFPPLSIPQITGVLDAPRSFKSYWHSNASAFLSWEIYDFGLRHHQVMEARTSVKRADAAIVLTKFQVACRAADAFFALVAAEEEVRAQQAALERMKVFAMTVHQQVKADLKPGVDASRVDAELAIAEDNLISAEQAREIRRATLAERMGMAGAYVETIHGPLLTVPTLPATVVKVQPFEYHPLALHQDAEVKTLHARYQVIQHEWRPHIFFESGIFGRGSGAQVNRSVASLGYLPNVPNWAVGVKAQMHLMDYFSVRAQKDIVANREQAERAKYAEIMQILKGDDARAKAMIDGATRLAANAPKFLKAAQDTELRARTRYGVGLANINDVALAEKLLIQAQVTNELAGLAVWRSYLAAAEARGDLTPLLKLSSGLPPNAGGQK
ncbi:MAG: TolC family protein [Candidatus Obscuribacterales bacterium]|nr:TolC family protein [Candidatus Obscuribacterales bacterium]